MFVSASLDLKIHNSTLSGVETHYVPHPPSTSPITTVSICNDNSYIGVLRENEKPQILSAKDLRNIRLIHVVNVSNVSALTFKRNTKKNIALGTKSGDVVMYDTKSRTVSKIYNKVSEEVKGLDFTCDDQRLCGIDGGCLFVFCDIASSDEVKKFKQESEVCFLKCHPFIEDRAAVGCTNGHVGVWDVLNGVELVGLEALNSSISAIAMSSCGNFLVKSSGKNLGICSMDFEDGTTNFRYHQEQERPVSSMDLSPDDKYLAVGLDDGTLKLYDIQQQMKLVFSSKIHETSISTIVFENRPKEINTNFSSLTVLAENNSVKGTERSSEIRSRTVSPRTKSIRSCKSGDESLDKLKKSVLRVIKNEMDSLENQMHEHCVKFQKFLDNEFETIDLILRKKWDIFNVGDMNQIIKMICSEDGKSNAE